MVEGGAEWARGPRGGVLVSHRARRRPFDEGGTVGSAPEDGGDGEAGAASEGDDAAAPGPGGLVCDPRLWAEAQFGSARLGDRRRVARLVALAAALARDPVGGLPRVAGSWGDLKAAYRLLARPEATFDSVASPHWEATRRDAPAGTALILDDTTEVDFGPARKAEGLGPVGTGSGRGFLIHSGLMVEPGSERVLGLAGQVLFHRRPAPAGETRTQRKSRDRESEVWGKLIERVGRPPEGARWIHVMDRGADDFEVHARARRLGADWVGRVKSRNRRVTDASGAATTVAGALDAAPEAGGYALPLRARPKQPARRAEVAVSFAAVVVQPPRMMAASLKALGPVPIAQWLVRARELRPPAGAAEPIDWVLLTSLPVTDLASAMAVIGHYERRWQVEEWHKALKTGCRVESRQLETSARLEALTGILSATAVRLLQLRGLARSEPTRPASDCLPASYVEALRGVQRVRPAAAWTIRDFVRALARLGGFLGRKSDGEPGWQTIWEGWGRLNWILRGYDLARATPPPLNG